MSNNGATERQTLLEVKKLCKNFHVGRKGILKAVEDVSFTLKRGETLSLVGESGCGKTTCGRTVLKLYNKTSGSIQFNGKEIDNSLTGKRLLEFKQNSQMIFQDPYSALDPRMTIGEIIAEGMDVHFKYTKSERNEIINELLFKIGLTTDYANRFPHELSGGQRQRVGIARALAVNPSFIVCDEPISALDVSIQAQIINLLIGLQNERELAYLFISHDLAVVEHISDRVGVMYLGNMVELAESNELFAHPGHPYTKALLSAIPTADPEFERSRQRVQLEGEVPSPINPPSGCKFRTRCPLATERCAEAAPELREIGAGHFMACHNC